jgi:FkbM family methyltransferase
MTFLIPFPDAAVGTDRYIDIIDGQTTAVQRALRRDGLAGYEPPTMASILAAFELLPSNFTFFDVGANIGLYSLLCNSVFPKSRIVAFEPTPDTAEINRTIAEINATGTRVEELALGKAAGKAQLFLSAKSDASNSLVEGFKPNVGSVDVDVETLDGYVRRSGLVPSIVKIDAETFEPEILAGGRSVLSNHRPMLIVEVLNRKGHDHGEEMAAEMEGLGYSYYRCSTDSDWVPSPTISGDPDGDLRDWLFTVEPLPPGFGRRAQAWADVVARCTADRNNPKDGAAVLLDSHPPTGRFEIARQRARRMAGRLRERSR